jgi:hypothetical protein
VTFANPVSGNAYIVKFEHTGAGTKTITWPGIVKWAGAQPGLSSVSGYVDIIALFYDGTNYYASYNIGYAA